MDEIRGKRLKTQHYYMNKKLYNYFDKGMFASISNKGLLTRSKGRGYCRAHIAYRDKKRY